MYEPMAPTNDHSGRGEPTQLAVAESDQAGHHDGMARAIRYLVANYQDQPSLADLSAAAGLHPHHFQRVFKRWTGVSPKRFTQYLTLEHAKAALRDRQSILDAAYDSGLSGPSRLHDLFVSCEAVTPGNFKDRGAEMTIRYGLHDGPLGRVLVALSDRGICWLGFVDSADPLAPDGGFVRDWGAAKLVADPAATAEIAQKVIETGSAPEGTGLLLKGTNFQIKVWQTLLSIPPGQVASYGQVARMAGVPGAARAVGTACARNNLALLIPCHRIIRETGVIDGYRWGNDRKRALLALEAAHVQAAA